MKKVLVFLHIPKTGGTTLNYILQEIYRWRFLWLRNDILIQESRHITPTDLYYRIPKRKRNRFKAIAGHQIHRILNHIPNSFSILIARNPIHHVPSYFFHHKRHRSGSPSNKQVRSYNSFNEFLESKSDYYPNPQSRSLLYDDPKIFDNLEKAKNKIYDIEVPNFLGKFLDLTIKILVITLIR